MSLFVDTSVWSLALRRDGGKYQEVDYLAEALGKGESVITTGLVLQELLQGFKGPRGHDQIIEKFSSLPLLIPERRDHIDAAGLRNVCRRKGIQIGTIDALLAQLCIRHELTMLSTDKDFIQISKKVPLRVWVPA